MLYCFSKIQALKLGMVYILVPPLSGYVSYLSAPYPSLVICKMKIKRKSTCFLRLVEVNQIIHIKYLGQCLAQGLNKQYLLDAFPNIGFQLLICKQYSFLMLTYLCHSIIIGLNDESFPSKEDPSTAYIPLCLNIKIYCL